MTDREGIAEAVYDYVQGFHEKENKIEELEKTIEDHNDMVEAYDAVDCERLGAEAKIEEFKKEIKELEKTIEDNDATILTWKMSCKLKDNEIEELEKTIKKAICVCDQCEDKYDVAELKKLLKEAEGDFDYSEDDDWDCAYGSGWEINDDGYPEWTIVMAGGGAHWWNYVIRPNGIYKCDKNGYDKLKGQLISCPEGTYVYHKDFMDPTDNGSREGESYMDEMIDWEDAPNPSTC